MNRLNFTRKAVVCFVLIVAVMLQVGAIPKISQDILFEHAKYKYMVEKNPQDPWAHFNLAVTYAYMGKLELGLEALGKVDKLDKQFAPKVIDRYERATKKSPDDWRLRFRLAFAYYFDDQKDKAIEELKKVAVTEPVTGKNAWAYGYIAYIYGEQKKWDEAIAACEKALEIEPEAGALHLAYAYGLMKKGDKLKATSEAITGWRLRAEEKKYEQEHNIQY
jgi:tetratricopeptide (TPR) repeat protein